MLLARVTAPTEIGSYAGELVLVRGFVVLVCGFVLLAEAVVGRCVVTTTTDPSGRLVVTTTDGALVVDAGVREVSGGSAPSVGITVSGVVPGGDVEVGRALDGLPGEFVRASAGAQTASARATPPMMGRRR